MLENPVNFINLYHKCNWLNVFNIPNYWLNCTLNRNGHLCSNWLYVYIMASSHEAFLRITNEKKFWNTCTFSSCRVIMWSNTVSISCCCFLHFGCDIKNKKVWGLCSLHRLYTYAGGEWFLPNPTMQKREDKKCRHHHTFSSVNDLFENLNNTSRNIIFQYHWLSLYNDIKIT